MIECHEGRARKIIINDTRTWSVYTFARSVMSASGPVD